MKTRVRLAFPSGHPEETSPPINESQIAVPSTTGSDRRIGSTPSRSALLQTPRKNAPSTTRQISTNAEIEIGVAGWNMRVGLRLTLCCVKLRTAGGLSRRVLQQATKVPLLVQALHLGCLSRCLLPFP